MIRPSLTISQLVDRLNVLLELDSEVVNAIISVRFNVAERKIAFNPDVGTVQATVTDPESGQQVEKTVMGALSLLNFLFGLSDKGMSPILAIYRDSKIEKFVVNPRISKDELEGGRE